MEKTKFSLSKFTWCQVFAVPCQKYGKEPSGIGIMIIVLWAVRFSLPPLVSILEVHSGWIVNGSFWTFSKLLYCPVQSFKSGSSTYRTFLRVSVFGQFGIWDLGVAGPVLSRCHRRQINWWSWFGSDEFHIIGIDFAVRSLWDSLSIIFRNHLFTFTFCRSPIFFRGLRRWALVFAPCLLFTVQICYAFPPRTKTKIGICWWKFL